MKDVDLTAEFIDMESVTDRAEEIERELIDAATEAGIEWDPTDGLSDLAGNISDDLTAEAETMRDLLNDLRGGGGDHQWRGDWYPATLIREDQFEGYMDEMLEDCGDLPKDLPCYLKITVDYDALRMDYAEVEIGDHTYLYR